MMKPLFKTRISKFGSLLSMTAIVAMLMVFSLVLPEFIASTAGRIFSGLWAVTVLVVFVAHMTRLGDNRKKGYLPGRPPAVKKDVRVSAKLTRTQRMMRG